VSQRAVTLAPQTSTTHSHTVRSWVIPTFVAMIGAFMSILDTTIVNVAIPKMLVVFGTTPSGIEWVSTIYTLALGVVTPLAGWLGDYLGYRRLYIAALAVFTLGSGLCAVAGSLGSLIAFRVLQAVGGGLIMPMVMAMVMQMVPRERFGTAMGIFGMALLLAPAIGPTVGGYLVQYVDWRWVFTINVPIGILGIFLARLVLPAFDDEEAGSFDWWGAAFVAISLFSLLLALSEGQSWGWGSESIVYLFYIAAVFMGLFIWRELTTPEPLLDLRLFRYPSFTLGNLVLFIMTIGMFGALFYLPIFLQDIRGLGAFQAGLTLLPPALVTMVTMPVAGFLYDKLGPRLIVPLGILFLALSTFLFRNLSVETALSTIILWNSIRSFGMGLSMMPIQSAVLSEVPSAEASRASSITNIVSRLAGSFGIALLTIIFTNNQALQTSTLRTALSSTDPVRVQGMAQLQAALMHQGMSPLQAQAVAGALIQGQLSTLAFTHALNNVFVILSFSVLLGLIPAFFLKKGSVRRGGLAVE
jgi:EmrB/QacA subfamily drug resistance transporter